MLDIVLSRHQLVGVSDTLTVDAEPSQDDAPRSPWLAACASLIGRDHVLLGRNGQDHAVARAGGDWALGAVSDGCGAARGSELGARVSAIVAAREATAALGRGTTLEAVARDVEREVKRVLRAVAREVAGEDAALFAAVHLTATLLVAVVRRDEALVFGWGDGLVRIDGRVAVIDEGGRPRYLASDLGSERPAPYSVIERADGARSLAVATDGFDEHVLAELPFAGSAALLRWMRIRARSGAFADDGAVASITPSPVGARRADHHLALDGGRS